MGGALLTVVAAALALDGSLRAEMRAGPTIARQDPDAATLAGELRGRAPGPDGTFLFDIAPTLSRAYWDQPFTGGPLDLLFLRGAVEGDLRIPSGWLRARQSGGYGTQDLSALSVTSPDAALTQPGQPPPRAQFIRIQESNTSAEMDVAPSRRLRLRASAAWNVAGGADALARTFMPLARGPQAQASAEFAATRVDTLRAQAAATQSTYSNGRATAVGTLSGAWRTLPSRAIDLTLSAGAGVGRASFATGPPTTVPYPLASADLAVTAARDAHAGAGVSVEPLGDVLTGDLIERGTARAYFTWGSTRGFNVTARATGSVAITSSNQIGTGTQAGDRYWQGEVSATAPLTNSSALVVGARALFLSRALPDQAPRQWAGFIGYTASAPLLRW
jgi:hypothetical protein